MFFSHKNFPSNTVIFRSPLSKQMKLLGLVGRQETWGPTAQFELRCPLTDQQAHLLDPQPSIGLYEDTALGHSYANLGPYRLTAKGILCWHSGCLGARGTDAVWGLIGPSASTYVHVTSSLKQRLLTWGSNIPCEVYSHRFNWCRVCANSFFLHKWLFSRAQQFPVQEYNWNLCISTTKWLKC